MSELTRDEFLADMRWAVEQGCIENGERYCHPMCEACIEAEDRWADTLLAGDGQ